MDPRTVMLGCGRLRPESALIVYRNNASQFDNQGHEIYIQGGIGVYGCAHHKIQAKIYGSMQINSKANADSFLISHIACAL